LLFSEADRIWLNKDRSIREEAARKIWAFIGTNEKRITFRYSSGIIILKK
jgi:hypothetical protein